MSRRQNKPHDIGGTVSRLAGSYYGPSLIGLLSRFGTVGVVATLSYLIISTGLKYIIGLSAIQSSVVAYITCIAISYLGQSRFTFRKTGDNIGQITRFIAMSLVGLVISYVVPKVLTIEWGHPAFVGFLVISVLIPALSFVVMKLWVFR